MKIVDNKRIGLFAGLFFMLLLLFIPTPEGLSPEAHKTAAVAILMIVWWITEAVPVYITAFVPIVLFPFFGILTSAETTQNYGHDYVLMLLGAFILAKAIEKQNLHKRLALNTINLLGTNNKSIIMAFMTTTAFLSMWITNMAVVLIMLPIASAVIERVQIEKREKFGSALLLGIAYAASIGGTGTLIGSPPNLVFAGLLNQLYPGSPEIGFLEWMQIGIPLVVISLPLVWLYLIWYFKINSRLEGGKSIISEQLELLGTITKGEKRVAFLFLLTALGWIFRKDITLGSYVLSGWGSILDISDYVHDSTVAMTAAVLTFVIGDGNGKRLIEWNTAKNIPWGVAMFLGGGLALGLAFKTSGLASWLGNSLVIASSLPDFLLILLITGLIIFITEVNSNTATATIFLPVLGMMAITASINPLFIMIPATFACSFAFMLPSGTGTNTVIFASERITIANMAKTGFWLNIIFVMVLPLLMYFVLLPLIGITIELPEWAS